MIKIYRQNYIKDKEICFAWGMTGKEAIDNALKEVEETELDRLFTHEIELSVEGFVDFLNIFNFYHYRVK